MWCEIMTAFIVGPFFLEEITHVDPVICTITGKWHEDLLLNHLLPAFQQCQCGDLKIFMQNGTSQQIDTPEKQLLNALFVDDRIINHHLPIA